MGQFNHMDFSRRHADFERWLHTPLGHALYENQSACVDTHAAGLTGARQLHVGISHELPLATESDFSQRVMTVSRWQEGLSAGVAVADADELPFPGDSMDLVILHHSADFSAYPHQVIREASRVLRGGGHLLVLGFNPISVWGLRKWLSRRGGGPWSGRFMLRSRMEDWLRLLDFQVESAGSHFLRLPVQRAAQVDKLDLGRLPGLRFLPLGAYYCIFATKRVCAPIKSRPVWRRQKVVALPSARPLGVSRGHRAVVPLTEQE